MTGTLLHITLLVLWPAVEALFRVEVDTPKYVAELHSNITMACMFSSGSGDLSVIWQRIHSQATPDEVYRMENGKENYAYQSPQFATRASLAMEELKKGKALLRLSNVGIQDAGTYRCMISRDGADYKQVKLTVQASYTMVKKSLRNVGKEEVELSCESQGFPLAQVVWKAGQSTDLGLTVQSSNVSITTHDGRLNLTSKVVVKRDAINNYTCTYMVEGQENQTAIFAIPDEISTNKTQSSIAIGLGVFVMVVVGLGLVLYCGRRGLLPLVTRSQVSKSQRPLTSRGSILQAQSLIPANECLPEEPESSSIAIPISPDEVDKSPHS